MYTPDKNHETVLRMLNEQLESWEITGERLEAFGTMPYGVLPKHQAVFEEMLSLALDGVKTWTRTVERYAALRAYVEFASAPAQDRIPAVLSKAQLGAVRDQVVDREWVQDVLVLLHDLSGVDVGSR